MLKGVELQDVFETLQVYLGSLYVNDFNLFGRTWQVIVAGRGEVPRPDQDDIRRLRVRNIRAGRWSRSAPLATSARSTDRWC